MRIFLLIALLQWCMSGLAQDRCVSAEYLQVLKQDVVHAERIEAANAYLRNKPLQKGIAEDVVIQIPVVVHVIYNQGSQNISDAQIQSGIEVLNRDFRKRNADAVNTPPRFRHLAADVQIEFYLAKADARGRMTTGIERKYTSRNGWVADDKMKFSEQGGLNGWDSKSYLNIWLVNLIGGSGYASVPGGAPAVDGIVINGAAFGTSHSSGPFSMGRTAVHEVGHWLGLKHIWGETQCGDDGVADTPPQSYFTSGCPSTFRSSCNNGELGDMYMNYMDYTNDACMNLFTLGQRERMRALFAEGGPRASLLQSKGLSEPWLQESALSPATGSLFPNPASDKVTIQVPENRIGQNIQLYNSYGQGIQLISLQSVQQTVNISHLPAGVYLLKGKEYQQKFIKL